MRHSILKNKHQRAFEMFLLFFILKIRKTILLFSPNMSAKIINIVHRSNWPIAGSRKTWSKLQNHDVSRFFIQRVKSAITKNSNRCNMESYVWFVNNFHYEQLCINELRMVLNLITAVAVEGLAWKLGKLNFEFYYVRKYYAPRFYFFAWRR